MSDLIDRQALLKQIDIDSDGEPGYYGDTWKFIDTIKSMPPATQLSTNLAEVGTDVPDINVGDMISRQAAINAIDECYCGGEDSCGEPWIYRENAVEAIQMIEPILPAEPKRGKWHYSDGKPARIGLSFGVICDQCGTESEYCTNFCGECGADMRQKGENSESN